MATVLIGGDICPIGRNVEFFLRGDATSLFHDLLDDFAAADFVLANLECPFIDGEAPISKTGPVFGVDGRCINGIRAAGIDMLCLANNHIMDHGALGLKNTLAVCQNAGIATVGAGVNLAAARRLVIRCVDGVRVAVLAMAEHEFSIATPNRPGANPLDLIDFVRTVANNRDSFDYLIVLLHGGPEFFTVPSPRLKETCHFLIEMGANTVVVQHPHSLGGIEHYRNGHIAYGQGALIMDEALYRDTPSFHEGVVILLTLAADGSSSMDLLPFVQSDSVPGARRMQHDRAAVFLRSLAEKSAAILDDDYIQSEWLNFCEQWKDFYLSAVLGHNRVLKRLNRHGLVRKLLYDNKVLLGTRNVVCCESHREAIETIFNEGMI